LSASARGVAAALSAIVIVSTALAAASTDGTAQEQLDALRTRIEQLRARLTDTEGTKAEARDQLRDSERAISESNRSLRELAARREATRGEIRTLTAQIRAAELDIAARQQMLGRLLAQHYLYGEQNYLRLILSGVDPNQTARELHYFGYLSADQARFIQILRERVARTRELESASREKVAEFAAIELEQRTRRGDLLKQQAEHRKVLARVSTELRMQRREVRNLERDETRLSRLVEELAKVVAAAPGFRNERLPEADGRSQRFVALKGKLRLPARGEIVNRFGVPRSGGGPAWKGLFIRSAPGEEVRAVAAGRVVFADWLRGFGNLLILDHGEAYLTIYGNNESLLRQVGDVVRTGDVVATIGNSGGSPDSGIYFEIRHEGRPFDPLRWVSLR
jgi:septal ring factor EnvC (AmiA/AmiB activator)